MFTSDMNNTRTLKLPKPLTQTDFYQVCRMNKDLAFERDANSNLLILPLKGGELGSFNAAISAEVGIWNRKVQKGKAFDSSTGFTLPDSSVRSPDTAWITIERRKALPLELLTECV